MVVYVLWGWFNTFNGCPGAVLDVGLTNNSFLAHRKYHTVDGRNPAPVDRYFIPLFTRFCTSQVVQDFFHQQYVYPIYNKINKAQTWSTVTFSVGKKIGPSSLPQKYHPPRGVLDPKKKQVSPHAAALGNIIPDGQIGWKRCGLCVAFSNGKDWFFKNNKPSRQPFWEETGPNLWLRFLPRFWAANAALQLRSW